MNTAKPGEKSKGEMEAATGAIASGSSQMKRTFNLRNCFAGATIVPAILFVGCGKVPIDDPSTEAYQIEALGKEAASHWGSETPAPRPGSGPRRAEWESYGQTLRGQLRYTSSPHAAPRRRARAQARCS